MEGILLKQIIKYVDTDTKVLQSGAKIVRLILRKESFQAHSPPISILGTNLKGFRQLQTYVTTLIWGKRGKNWVVSNIFASDCRLEKYQKFIQIL